MDSRIQQIPRHLKIYFFGGNVSRTAGWNRFGRINQRPSPVVPPPGSGIDTWFVTALRRRDGAAVQSGRWRWELVGVNAQIVPEERGRLLVSGRVQRSRL